MWHAAACGRPGRGGDVEVQLARPGQEHLGPLQPVLEVAEDGANVGLDPRDEALGQLVQETWAGRPRGEGGPGLGEQRAGGAGPSTR